MRLNESIRYHRKRHGISQERLALLAGLAPKHLQKIESGNLPAIRLSTLARLAGALSITPSELLQNVQLDRR